MNAISTPVVSVIVPIYNCEEYLEECINSIIHQTYTDIEIVLVDDGSTDRSPEICDKYALFDSRVKVIHKKNEGVSVARNCGVSNCRGSFVCFVDSDDMLHREMVSTLLKPMITNGVQISCCFENEGVEPDWPEEVEQSIIYTVDESFLVKNYRIGSINWVVTRKIIDIQIPKAIPFVPGRIYEDNEVMMKWLSISKEVAINTSGLYFYRSNPNSLTRVDFNYSHVDVLWSSSRRIKYFKKKKYYQLVRKLCGTYFNDSLAIYKKMKNAPDCRNYLQKWKRAITRTVFLNLKYSDMNKAKFFAFLELFYPWTIRVYGFLRPRKNDS